MCTGIDKYIETSIKFHYEILYRIEPIKTDVNRNISSLHLDKDFPNLICMGK